MTGTVSGQRQPGPATKEEPVAHFVDFGQQAGLDMQIIYGGKDTKKYIIETTGTGVALLDYDNDGWLDIFFVNGRTLEGTGPQSAPSNRLYRNLRNGKFAEVTNAAGLEAAGWGQGACAGDYDNDGWQDLYVTYYGQNRLYHNRGGVFEEVSEKAGVAGTSSQWGTGCAFLDYDRDGRLDLIVARYVYFDLATAPVPGQTANCVWKSIPVMCGPRGLKKDSNVLYRNRGDGTFEDVTARSGINKTPGHYCFSVSTLDYDDDGWTDIYIACDSTPSILYRNQGDGTFTDVAVIAGAAYNEDGHAQAGMGSTVADYNGDGHLDLFKTNFSDDTSTLYRNNGNGTFNDVTYAAGLGLNTQYLGWGTMFFDFDNDSWPDLLLVNGHVYPEVDTYNLGSSYAEPKLLYHNQGNGTFRDISRHAGPGINTPSSARGLAMGDLWNDGRMSAVISNMHGKPSLLVNEARSSNHWVAFKLVGSQSNRDGIGARLTLKAGTRQLVDEVRSGSSYNSSNDQRVHFGLGPATRVDWLEVRWPSGLRERFEGLAVDTVHILKEATGKPVDSAETKPPAPTVPRQKP
ncbi:MAG TPA: CRTAC1 family protein [Terriglobales bacterium]|nr:CRTAC1 family protein [Terriglobales bacterium]